MWWSMSPTNGNMLNTAKTAEWFFFLTIWFLYVVLCHTNRVKQHAKLLINCGTAALWLWNNSGSMMSPELASRIFWLHLCTMGGGSMQSIFIYDILPTPFKTTHTNIYLSHSTIRRSKLTIHFLFSKILMLTGIITFFFFTGIIISLHWDGDLGYILSLCFAVLTTAFWQRQFNAHYKEAAAAHHIEMTCFQPTANAYFRQNSQLYVTLKNPLHLLQLKSYIKQIIVAFVGKIPHKVEM